MAARKEPPPYRDKIDVFVTKLLEEDSEAAIRPVIRPLIAKLRTAKSYDEMKRLVAAAVADMDLEPFCELMARAEFAVNLNGNLDQRK